MRLVTGRGRGCAGPAAATGGSVGHWARSRSAVSVPSSLAAASYMGRRAAGSINTIMAVMMRRKHEVLAGFRVEWQVPGLGACGARATKAELIARPANQWPGTRIAPMAVSLLG
jgi:hypothetical protein